MIAIVVAVSIVEATVIAVIAVIATFIVKARCCLVIFTDFSPTLHSSYPQPSHLHSLDYDHSSLHLPLHHDNLNPSPQTCKGFHGIPSLNLMHHSCS
jgi:hypothetical protein